MRYPLCALLLAAMPLVPVRVERAIDDSRRCSIAVVPGYRARAEAVLLATASADTLLAGPGRVVPSRFVGHFGTGAPGLIYGQLFEVARFSGADSARLRTAFRLRGDMRVVIVPWDYDPACDPTRWTRGSAWVPVAKAGTFTVALRPDSLWTDGIPVFDAFNAALEPYPYGQPLRVPPSFRTSEALSAEQYFELLTAMPTGEDQRERPDSAWRAFLRWRDANPALADMYPANQVSVDLARSLSWNKARRGLRSIEPLIAGTFRMTSELDGGAGRSFYVRTRGRPQDEWQLRTPRAVVDPLREPPRPDAYNVLASGAPSLAALPAECATDGSTRDGYMYVIDPARAAGDRRREWDGWIEVSLIARQFPEDSALARFQRQEFREWSARWRTAQELEAPARFWLDDGGRLQVEQTTRLADGQTLVVRGERVSPQVVACEW